ncbi:DNA resolvase [Acetobacter tropicalis NBRC 101654]|nr:DNA resolvase [Acetobacter tropicalis NBRC 101654]
MVQTLQEGDTVVVTRIDRLARSTFDLFGIVRDITQKKARFYSLAEPWVDTATSTGRLMLAVLGGLADVERDLIRIRTAEGRARAIEQGRRMGRPRRITDAQRQEIAMRRQEGEALHSIASAFGISDSTVSRIASGKDSHAHRKLTVSC